MLLRFLYLTLLTTAHATSLGVVVRDNCTPCQPQGATGTNPPAFGSDLKDLYLDVLASVKDIHFRKRWTDSVVARDDDFCCRESLDCVNVQNLNIPMCYDKFTTNFFFADSSYGSLTTGDYTHMRDSANLISGDWFRYGGEKGNMYADDPSAKPNTATLSIPPQWTGTGVGSAIPASEIGSVAIITTVVGGTTVTGPTTLPAITTLGTTIPAQTITGPTTIAPSTTVMTTTIGGGNAQNTAASSSSTGLAAHLTADSTNSFAMSLFTALMYMIYAL